MLTTEPLLKYPDFSRQFILTTDASKDAIGAVLWQDFDDGKDLSFEDVKQSENKLFRH